MSDEPGSVDKRALTPWEQWQEIRDYLGHAKVYVGFLREDHGDSRNQTALEDWFAKVELCVAESLKSCQEYDETSEIKKIREWPWQDGWADLLAFVRTFWHIPDWGFKQDGKDYAISTGGWSGNEELMGALRANIMFWMVCWKSSRRGGHFEFEIPEKVK